MAPKLSRRSVLQGSASAVAAGLVAGGAALQGRPAAARPAQVLRPPGALSEERFLGARLRRGPRVRDCPPRTPMRAPAAASARRAACSSRRRSRCWRWRARRTRPPLPLGLGCRQPARAPALRRAGAQAAGPAGAGRPGAAALGPRCVRPARRAGGERHGGRAANAGSAAAAFATGHCSVVPARAAGGRVAREGQPVVQPGARHVAAHRPLRSGAGAGRAPRVRWSATRACCRCQRATRAAAATVPTVSPFAPHLGGSPCR